jgi:hypothetical protein
VERLRLSVTTLLAGAFILAAMSGVAGKVAPAGVVLLDFQRWCTCMRRCLGGRVVDTNTFYAHVLFRLQDEEDPDWWQRAGQAPQEDEQMDGLPHEQPPDQQLPEQFFDVHLEFIPNAPSKLTCL